MKTFDQEKEFALSKKDKSHIGGVDIQIKPVVDKINSMKDYFTTSSCAGRIAVIEFGEKTKLDSKWLYVSHEISEFEKIRESLNKLDPNKQVWLKQESWIIHICCKDIEKANDLLKICHSLGLKRSGIISIHKKVMVEVMSTESLSVPIAEKGELIVKDDFLKYLIEKSNLGLKNARKRLDDFLGKLKINYSNSI